MMRGLSWCRQRSARTVCRRIAGPGWLAPLCLLLASLSVRGASAGPGGFRMPPVPGPTFPGRAVSLADVGGVGDGKTLNTGAIARAVASLAQKGGGRLVIPPGMWLTGPIRLRSNIDLHLEAGALLQFTPDYKQY